MLIDMHVHLLPPKRLAGLLKWMHRYYAGHPVPVDVTLDQLIDDYAKLKVDYLFNFAYPIEPQETEALIAFNAGLRSRHPWIIPWGSLHPENPGKAQIVELCIRDHNFLGFKFHPFIQRFDPLDPRMPEAYQALQDLGRPCVFHTGFEEFYGLSLPVSTMEQIVRSFPRLPVVFAHSLFPEFGDAFRMLERYDTVWLEMTNVFGALWDDRYRVTKLEPQKKVLLEGIGAHSDRIMFGSDHPAGMGTLEEIYRTLAGLRFPETVKETPRGEPPRRFVERFKPGFFSRVPASPKP